MQKWEYKTVEMRRQWKSYSDEKAWPSTPMYKGNAWNCQIDGKDVSNDLGKLLEYLGDLGFELVGISTRSGYLGGWTIGGSSMDYAGFTSDETWVFKRPKE